MTVDDEIREALEARADALDEPPPSLESIHRDASPRTRGRRGVLVAAAILVAVATATAVAWRERTDTSSVTTGQPGAEEPALPDPDQVATTEPTATSIQVTELPEDWEVRITDGAERDGTLRLLDAAVAAIGPGRSGYYDNGDGFEVRVVEPTSQDEDTVALLQAETSIPLKVVAVPMSASWLERTTLRLDADLSNPAASVGADLKAGKLFVAIDRQKAPELRDDAFAEQVRELVETYLLDGRQEGAVAEGVTADQAIDITEGRWG